MAACFTGPRRFARSLLFLVAVGSGLSGHAADPPPPEPDVVLALKARSALADDPELKGLNLLVSVVDRVAVVGGPVPDAGLATRVEAAVRKVPGLAGVKVSCWVPAAENPLTKLVADRLKDPIPPLPSPPAKAPPDGPPLAVIPRLAPDLPPSPGVLAAGPRPIGTVTVQRVVPPVGSAGFLLDPVAPGVTALPMPAAAGTLTEYPTIPAPAVPTRPAERPTTFETAVAELKARAPRFAGLTVTVANGTATIAGVTARGEDAWAFADAIRQFPGVRRVVVGKVNGP